MSKLDKLTKGYIEEDVSIRQMETGYLKQLLSLCLVLLKFVIRMKIEHKSAKRPEPLQGEGIKSKGKRYRKYLSLFGLLEFSRPSYWSDQRGMLYVLDSDLDFPSELWSYNLQQLTGGNASEVNFRESVKTINTLLDLGLSGTSSERNIERLGSMVEGYYEEKEPLIQKEPVCFSASFDGKGVPKIKPRDKEKPREINRLGKGQKRGVKQMATVGVMSWFEPKERDIDSVVRGLMGSPLSNKQRDKLVKESEQNDNRWHQGIHRRAFLTDQDKCIDYGIGYIKSMMGNSHSKLVIPIDGGIGLEAKILKYVKKHDLETQFDGIILDIIHVSQYVWDCVNAIFGEQSKLRTDWVKQMLEDLLNSKTAKVIEDLEKIVAKGDLSKTKRRTIQKAITYFTNHRHKMDYKTFIDKGYPVSSALVESNCGHLVKDRMEQSGMRWSSKGAQNMLDMRAVKLNEDLDDFISFVGRQNRKKDFKVAA
jgi:hypothetical protein